MVWYLAHLVIALVWDSLCGPYDYDVIVPRVENHPQGLHGLYNKPVSAPYANASLRTGCT